VQVFDFGTQDEALYLVMEYVRGLDMGALLERDGVIPVARAISLFGQVLAALEEAHDLGIIHRDLKPENILVTRTQRGKDYVKVLDFGLAKLMEREEASAVTDRDLIVGTPYYMSPEQVRGDDVDARSDIYSIGALMYRVLTGEYPFTGTTPVVVLTRHLTDQPMAPTAVRPDLSLDPFIDEIILRCMSKDPGARYPDVGALMADLEELSFKPDSGIGRAPTSGPFDNVDLGPDTALRLRRSDVDRFERSLKKKHLARVVVLPLLLVGLFAAGIFVWAKGAAGARRVEQEPNNTAADATLIALGVPVTGFIGQRQSKTEPDKDLYTVRESPNPNGSTVVTVRATAIPNVDLQLSLLDRSGREIATANAGGVGDAEGIRRFHVTKPFLVSVGQVRPKDSLPVENVSDSYTLTVELETTAAGQETEPNENVTDANTFDASRGAVGYLDRPGDVDYWHVKGPAGRYRVQVEHSVELPLQWEIDGQEARSGLTLAPPARALLKIFRTDQSSADVAGAEQPYKISVTPIPR